MPTISPPREPELQPKAPTSHSEGLPADIVSTSHVIEITEPAPDPIETELQQIIIEDEKPVEPIESCAAEIRENIARYESDSKYLVEIAEDDSKSGYKTDIVTTGYEDVSTADSLKQARVLVDESDGGLVSARQLLGETDENLSSNETVAAAHAERLGRALAYEHRVIQEALDDVAQIAKSVMDTDIRARVAASVFDTVVKPQLAEKVAEGRLSAEYAEKAEACFNDLLLEERDVDSSGNQFDRSRPSRVELEQIDGESYAGLDFIMREAGVSEFSRGDLSENVRLVFTFLAIAKAEELRVSIEEARRGKELDESETQRLQFNTPESSLRIKNHADRLERKLNPPLWNAMKTVMVAGGVLTLEEFEVVEQGIIKELEKFNAAGVYFNQEALAVLEGFANPSTVPLLINQLRSDGETHTQESAVHTLTKILRKLDENQLRVATEGLNAKDLELIEVLINPESQFHTLPLQTAAHYIEIGRDLKLCETLYQIALGEKGEEYASRIYSLNGSGVEDTLSDLKEICSIGGLEYADVVAARLTEILQHVNIKTLASDIDAVALALGKKPSDFYDQFKENLSGLLPYYPLSEIQGELSSLAEKLGKSLHEMMADYKDRYFERHDLQADITAEFESFESCFGINPEEVYELIKDKIPNILSDFESGVDALKQLSTCTGLEFQNLVKEYSDKLLSGINYQSPRTAMSQFQLLSNATGVSIEEIAMSVSDRWLQSGNPLLKYLTNPQNEMSSVLIKTLIREKINESAGDEGKVDQILNSKKMARSRIDRENLLLELNWLSSRGIEGRVIFRLLVDSYSGSQKDAERFRKALQMAHGLDKLGGLGKYFQQVEHGISLVEQLKKIEKHTADLMAEALDLDDVGTELLEKNIDKMTGGGLFEIVSSLTAHYGRINPTSREVLKEIVLHHLQGDFKEWRDTHPASVDQLSGLTDQQKEAWLAGSETTHIIEYASPQERLAGQLNAINDMVDDIVQHTLEEDPELEFTEKFRDELRAEISGLRDEGDSKDKRDVLAKKLEVVEGILHLRSLTIADVDEEKILASARKLREAFVGLNYAQPVSDVEQIGKAFAEDTFGELTVVDTDALTALLNSGIQPRETCQSWRSGGNYNQGLMATTADANKRLIAVKDRHGAVLARTIIKLMSYTGEDGTEKPVVLIEPVYVVNATDGLYRGIFKHLAQKVASLSVAVVDPSQSPRLEQEAQNRKFGVQKKASLRIHTPASINGVEYSDSLGALVPEHSDRQVSGLLVTPQ